MTYDWQHWRASRRSVLRGAATGTAGLAAAALLGCGSGSSATATPVATGQAASAATAAAATSSGATATAAASATPRSGGTLKMSTPIDVDTFDVLTALSYKTSDQISYVYSRLVQYQNGDGGPAPGKVIPDAAAKWEQPDQTTFVFHLRPGMKFDQRAPTNGRALNAQDVVQSWNKFKDKSIYRADLNHAVSPSASVSSVEAVDDQTVKFSLAFPDAIFLPILAWPFDYWVEPVEAMNGGFDPKSETRGSGPFILTDYKTAVSYTYQRNPDWYGAPRPYVDEIQLAVISDVAQSEAQFKAGNILAGAITTPVSIQDIPLVAGQMSDAYIATASPDASGPSIAFSSRAGQPWADVRVRQAFSMSLDRDAYIQVISAPAALEKIGVHVDRYWNTPLSPGYGAFWLDPKGKDFGDSAQYLQHNVPEAKKLLAAAGFDSSHALEAEFIWTPQYWADWQTRAQTMQAMAADAGIKLTIYSAAYTQEYLPHIVRSHGDFGAHSGSGAACAIVPLGARADPGQWLNVFFESTGAGNIVGTQYPQLDSLIEGQRKVFDFQTRVQKVQDIQRYMVQNMVAVPANPTINTVTIANKKLHGPERYQIWPGGSTGSAAGTEIFPYYWMDA